MDTPKNYFNSIKAGVVSMEMLGEACYSCNKRAKNYRDREAGYQERRRNNRYWCDIYGDEERCREKKEEFYRKKDYLLSLVTPSCIHEVSRRRINVVDQDVFDGEDDPDVKIIDCFDRFDEDLREYVEYVKYSYTENEYFLYYELGNHTFHTPIDCVNSDLTVVHLDSLFTEGENINNLLSVQFCDKIIKGFQTGTLRLVDTNV